MCGYSRRAFPYQLLPIGAIPWMDQGHIRVSRSVTKYTLPFILNLTQSTTTTYSKPLPFTGTIQSWARHYFITSTLLKSSPAAWRFTTETF